MSGNLYLDHQIKTPLEENGSIQSKKMEDTKPDMLPKDIPKYRELTTMKPFHQ